MEIVDQDEHLVGVGAGVEADRRAGPVDGAVALDLVVHHARTVADAEDEGAAGFGAGDIGDRLALIVEDVLEQVGEALGAAAEHALGGVEHIVAGNGIALLGGPVGDLRIVLGRRLRSRRARTAARPACNRRSKLRLGRGLLASGAGCGAVVGGGALCQLAGWLGSTVWICAAAGTQAIAKAAAAAIFTNDFSMTFPHTLSRTNLAPTNLSRP